MKLPLLRVRSGSSFAFWDRVSRFFLFSLFVFCTLTFLYSVAFALNVPHYFFSHTIKSTAALLEVGLILMSVCCYFLSQLFRFEERSSARGTIQAELPPPTGKALSLFYAAAIVVILGQALWGMRQQPFDYDEQNTAYEFLYRGWHRINPLRTETHPVAALASYTAFQMFGPGKMQGRLPALLFTLGFLILLARFVSRFCLPATGILLFSHLAANQLFIWYAHSLRGYISMMLWCLVLFMWVYELCIEGVNGFHPVWFFLAFVGAILTHSFGGVFAIALWMCVLIWGATHRHQLNEPQLANVRKVVGTGLVGVPILLAILGVHQKYIERDPNLFMNFAKPTPVHDFKFMSGVVSNLLGMSHFWPVYLVLILLLGLELSRIGTSKRPSQPAAFTGAFLLAYFGLFLALFVASHGQLLVGRFFLGVLPMVIWWAGEIIARHRFRNSLVAVSLVLLFAAPLWDGRQVTEWVADGHGAYDSFMRKVQTVTHPSEKTCFWSIGDKQKSLISIPLYLRPAQPLSVFSVCQDRFLLELSEEGGANSTHKSEGLPFPRQLVFSDGNGNSLFRLGSSGVAPSTLSR